MKIDKKLTSVLQFNWFIAILFILFLSGIFFFFRRQVATITVVFKITDENVLYAVNNPKNEFSNGYIVGDTEKDELGRVDAEITKVQAYQYTPGERTTYITIKLKALYNPRKHQYALRGKTIAMGETFTFSFSRIRLKGIVVDFPLLDVNRRNGKAIVKAQLIKDSLYYMPETHGVLKYIADAVKIGDELKDSNGNTLAKILNIEISPAKRITVTSWGEPRVTYDPLLFDVVYTIELQTISINSSLFMFNYMPLVVDALIPLNLPGVSLIPRIIEIISR